MSERATYMLKIYDTKLAEFEFVRDDLGTESIRGITIDEKMSHLLPMNLLQEASTEEMFRWLQTRRIPKNRAYADKILGVFGLTVNDTMAVIELSRGVSLNDAYSVVRDNSQESYADYNLYENSFDAVLQYVAYTGRSAVGQAGSGLPSELSLSGMFPKTWRIAKDDTRQLYKAGSVLEAANHGLEPYSEYVASLLLRSAKIDAVDYRLSYWNDALCTICDLFNNKSVSFVPYGNIFTLKQANNMNLTTTLKVMSHLGEESLQSFLSMLAMDFIIANSDRHAGNYGILRENATGEVIGFAPLFDHNLSLFANEFTADISNEEFVRAKLMAWQGASGLSLLQQVDITIGARQQQQAELMGGCTISVPLIAEALVYPQERVKIIQNIIQDNIEYAMRIPAKEPAVLLQMAQAETDVSLSAIRVKGAK